MRRKKMFGKIILTAGVFGILAVIETYSYFFGTLPTVNPFSTGRAGVHLSEDFNASDRWVPGEEKKKEAVFGNDGTQDVLLRVRFQKELIKSDDSYETSDAILSGFQLNYADTFEADWELHSDGWYYYKKLLKPNETTGKTLVSVTMNPAIGNDQHQNQTDYSNAKMNIEVKGEVVQASAASSGARIEDWDAIPSIEGNKVSWRRK